VPLGQATMVIVVFALTTIVAEPIAGWAMDRTSTPRIIAPCYITTCAGLWLLLHTGSQPLLLLAGLLIGVGAGAQFSVLPYLLSRYFGLKELGAISGVAYGGTLFFGSVAPLALNLTFDATGSYAAAIYGIVAILIYSAAMILTFPRYRYISAHA
jgi:MFS family permease